MIEIIQRKEIENSATGNAPAENTATGNIVTENRRTNEKAEDTATFPRNFRQIGTPEGEKHIFIEDYVYTYLHPAFLGMNGGYAFWWAEPKPMAKTRISM